MSSTTYPDDDPRLEFDQADRLRRALRVSHIGVTEMAVFLDVDRTTIGNWINGRARPRPRDLRGFAARTGFPVDWLESGTSLAAAANRGTSDYKAVISRSTRSSSRPPTRNDERRPSRVARISH